MPYFTRADYLASTPDASGSRAAAHRRYYAQFCSPAVVSAVAARIGSAAIMASRDPHLNDIPLHQWDNLEPLISLHCLGLMGDINGSTPLPDRKRSINWSLSDAVCIAKEAARQHAESLGSRAFA